MNATGFTPAQKATVLFRDGQKCAMCYERATTVNHRANRGHGGFKGANRISNGCAICWSCNGLIESDADYARLAVERGVATSRDDDPTAIPFLSPLYLVRVFLDDLGGFTFEEAS